MIVVAEKVMPPGQHNPGAIPQQTILFLFHRYLKITLLHLIVFAQTFFVFPSGCPGYPRAVFRAKIFFDLKNRYCVAHSTTKSNGGFGLRKAIEKPGIINPRLSLSCKMWLLSYRNAFVWIRRCVLRSAIPGTYWKTTFCQYP